MYDIPRQSFAIAAGGTSATYTIKGSPSTYSAYRGTAKQTIIEIPNWTNDVTLEYAIKDPRGKLLFKQTSLARNQLDPPVILVDSYPVFEGCVITLTLSGVPGGSGGTAYVTIYYAYEGR